MAAMFNNPRAVERDNQNSLRKFPFADAASCTNGSCVIVSGAIIDAQLYVPGREPGRVWLSSVGTDGKLRFSDSSGVFAETAAPATPDTAVPVVFTGDGGPCPGGVVVFGHAADVSALRACGGQSFTAPQAELAPAAVAWPGLPGVTGFRLDDGHVVYGRVKMRGENGCVVSTYVENGVGRLRISAVGETVRTQEVTGFITQVVVESDNRHFVATPRAEGGHVVDITAAGMELTQDDGLVADREDLCAQVRKTLGTSLSGRSAPGKDCVCAPDSIDQYEIALVDDHEQPVPNAASNRIPVLAGGSLGSVSGAHIPAKQGYHFVGYFDRKNGGRRYYRPDGSGVGKLTDTTAADSSGVITAYAQFVPAHSEVQVDFNGYGTLHLAAPDQLDYANPIRISGGESQMPVVHGISADTLAAGGAEAVADAIINPSTTPGEVHIGLRGLGKASML